jgi:hypothetical protein
MPVPTAALDAPPKAPVVGFPRSAKDLDQQESMPEIHADNITMNGGKQGGGESLVLIGEPSTVPLTHNARGRLVVFLILRCP